jgi:hypothetical protein
LAVRSIESTPDRAVIDGKLNALKTKTGMQAILKNRMSNSNSGLAVLEALRRRLASKEVRSVYFGRYVAERLTGSEYLSVAR